MLHHRLETKSRPETKSRLGQAQVQVPLNVFIIEDELHKHPRIKILEALKAIRAKVTVARSSDEAKAKFSPPYDVVLLDHDMRGIYESSDVPHSGFQFLKWSLLQGMWVGDWAPKAKVVIHSQNHTGARNMQAELSKHGIKAHANPFWSGYPAWLLSQLGAPSDVIEKFGSSI